MRISNRHQFKPQLLGSIIITVGFVVIYRLGVQIQIPFINPESAAEFFNTTGYFNPEYKKMFSIFALGLMPYVSAYLLVEVCSLFIPYLKKLRGGDVKGRRKLKNIALLLTLLVGTLQGNGIVSGLTDMTFPDGGKLINISSSYEYIFLILILVVSLFILILITELISRFGVGHGISIIILSGISSDISTSAFRFLKNFSKIELNMLLLLAVIFSAIALSTVLLLRTRISIPLTHRLSENSLASFQFNTCPSGSIAIGYAGSILMLPATIAVFLEEWHNLFYNFRPDSFIYNLIHVLLLFLLSYVLAALFLHPKRRIFKLQQRGWVFPENEKSPNNFLIRKLAIYNLPWTLFLGALAVMPHIKITAFEYPFFIGGTSMYIAFVIGLDILDRYNVQRQTPTGLLVKIAEFHDIYDASMIKSHLKSDGIQCHMQGYYHRHLYYFFGPYIGISLMVGPDQTEISREIIKKYYKGLGLINI